MENNVKYCHKCGAQNLQEYSFCKDCGTQLLTLQSENTLEQGQPSVQEPVSEQVPTSAPVQPAVYCDYIDGVPMAEINDYVGKNGNSFMPKFLKFSHGSKAGWNWPVFLFGLLLNIPFVWFFHRKMYKVGSIVLAVCLALIIATASVTAGILNMFAPIVSEFAEQIVIDMENDFYIKNNFHSDNYDDYYDDYYDDVYSYITEEQYAQIEQAVTEVMTSSKYQLLNGLSTLLWLLHATFIILISVFADYLYYKKVMKTLKDMNANGLPNGDVVHSAGGTNTAASILTGIFGYLSFCIISIMPVIYTLFNIFVQLSIY